MGTGKTDGCQQLLVPIEAVFANYIQSVFSLPLYDCIGLCSNYLSI